MRNYILNNIEPIHLTASVVKLGPESQELARINSEKKKTTKDGIPCKERRGIPPEDSSNFSYIGECGELAFQNSISGSYTDKRDCWHGSKNGSIDIEWDGMEIDVKTARNRFPKEFHVPPEHAKPGVMFFFATHCSGYVNIIGYLPSETVNEIGVLKDPGNRNKPVLTFPTGEVHPFEFDKKYMFLD